MTFQPVLPLSGYTGWRFLERTLDSQREAFNDSAPVQRATDAFREKIGDISSAADLVNNRQLLEVALGAFGLDDDINNKYFIQRILDDGTSDADALSNLLSDSRYKDFASAFGFGEGIPPRTQLSFFADEIIDRYEARQFEQAVGDQDNTLRLALNLEPALADVVAGNGSDTARWFAMMGNSALRSVFETSMGFPSSFSSLDLDLQLEQFRERAEATFGTSDMAELTSDDVREKMIRLYMVRSESQANSSLGGASVALSLLQQSQISYS